MNRAGMLLAGLAAAAASVWWPAVRPLAGQDLPVAKPRPIVIIGGMLIDGTGAPARRNDALVIRDGRITAMGLSASRKAPKDARLIDGTGKWILPGFIDAVVHLSRSGDLGARAESPSIAASADIRRAPAPYLRAYLCAGITTVLNIGGPAWTFDLRDGRVDDALSPRIETTGPALALTAAAKPSIAAGDELLSAASSDQVAALVGRLLPSKPALVAVRPASPGSADVGDTFVTAVIAAAHARRLRVVVEAATASELRSAVHAGADVIVTRVPDPIDDDLVRRIVAQHTVIVPTMVVGEARQRMRTADPSAADFEAACAPAASLGSLAALRSSGTFNRSNDVAAAGAVEGEQRNVRRLAEAGAMIVAGSGAGENRVFHGPSLHREFELLAGAGLAPMAIILSATRDAALLLGRRADLGQIEEGMAGDLVLVSADPLADIRNARKVVLTIRSGALYER